MFLSASDNRGRNRGEIFFYEIERRKDGNNVKGEILSTLRSKFFHKMKGRDSKNFFVSLSS
jgi:hypothetical protein